MSRIAIPVTALSLAGVAPSAQTDADATNKHTLANPSSRTLLEVVSSDGADQTVTFELAGIDPNLLDGAATPSVAHTVPAGATRWFGPFPKAKYNSPAIAADGLLTSDATAPANNETVTIDGHVYTFKTALTEAKAAATLTSDNTNVGDGETVTINDKTYRFKNTIAALNDVHIGANADATLTNLVNLINSAGTPGTDYFTGSTKPTGIGSASAVSSHATTITAALVGTAGNAFASTETSAHLSFGGATFAGGVAAVANEILIGGSAANALTHLKAAVNDTGAEGTDYSTGTAAHSTISASTLTSTTLLVVARTAGVGGDELATTEISAHLSWGAATLAGGAAASSVVLIDPSVSTTLKFRAFSI
jgi:hypothetical protein